jgi:hypothetical protein
VPLRLLAASLLLLTGCPEPRCNAPFIGDPDQPPEGVLLYTDGAERKYHEVAPGGTLPLMPPPQGGYVVYVGAKMKNVNGCVEFAGRFRNPVTKEEQGFDGRSSRLIPMADGYGWPDVADNGNVSNINPCPDYGPRDVHGNTWDLEVTVTDIDRRRVVLSAPTKLACQHAEPALQSDCICTCSANYVLGKCGSPDM